jgi:hypothetical protein
VVLVLVLVVVLLVVVLVPARGGDLNIALF